MTWEDLRFEVIFTPLMGPCENVALDQVLSDEFMNGRRGPSLRFWNFDAPVAVMGSFQSYENEINPDGVKRHGVLVTRRISGGGTMFMEPDNTITYSLIVPTSLVSHLSFAQSYSFLDSWIIHALHSMGIQAEYEYLNDIASPRGKIAGAAQKRFARGALLHHVTMAYDIDAKKMHECMRIGGQQLQEKGVRSAVKIVDPLRSQTQASKEEIVSVLAQYFSEKYDTVSAQLREDELLEARSLAEKKFLQNAWIHRVV